MKRYEFRWGHPVSNIDGEWIRYEDHCEAMKRRAAPSASAQQAGPVAWYDRATGAIYPLLPEGERYAGGARRLEPLYAAPAPIESPAALTVPAAITEWHAAWQAHNDAVTAYNARVAFARANEGERIGSISVRAEYDLMTDAKNAMSRMLPALFEGISALLAASPAAQEWQPIETAPKTGRTLLLGYPNRLGNWRTVRGQFFSQEYIGECTKDPDMFEPGWYETAEEADDECNCWAIAPTHWMPLPAAPAIDAAMSASKESPDA